MIFGRNMAVLVVVAVLVVFFFPAIEGPYPAVHGPVTALQAARAAARLRVVILRAACESVGSHWVWLIVFLPWASFPRTAFLSLSSFECRPVFRC